MRTIFLFFTVVCAFLTAVGAAQPPAPPGKAPDLLQQGSELLKKGSADSAKALFQQAALQDPDNAIVWYYLGSAQLSLQESQAAAESFEKALKLDDGKPTLGRKLRRETVDGLGLSYAYQKEYGRAKSAYQEGIAKEPEAPGLRYNLACVCALSGDRSGAVSALREALLADARSDATTLPDPAADNDFKGLLGDPLFQATLLVALGLQPNDRPGDSLARQGAKLMASGDFTGAAAQERAALDENPKNTLAWFLLGGTLDELKQEQKAAEAFRKALDLNIPPNSVLSKPCVRHAAMRSGEAFLEDKSREEALKAFQKAADADPFQPWCFYGQARACAGLGQREAALAALKKAFNLKENLTALDSPLPDPGKDPAFAAWAQDKEWQSAIAGLNR